MAAKNTSMTGIVSEELTEENYDYWKICLKSYLIGNGLWGVVSGRETKPEKNTTEYEEWRKKNALALHAIQLSCGLGVYAKFKEAHVSAKYAWDHLAEKHKRPPPQSKMHYHDEEGPMEEDGTAEYHHYDTLHKAVEDGNWPTLRRFLDREPAAVRAIVSNHKDTALHVAILCGHYIIAEELVKLMRPEDLEMTNEFGSTPLSLAAISGDKKLAKALVKKNRRLVSITTDHDDGLLPVIVAAKYGQKQMVKYLYSVTPKEELSREKEENGATLLNFLITDEIYDIASVLLKHFPHLGVIHDRYGDYTLRILAHKPSAFRSGTKFVFWKRWIYPFVRVHTPWDTHKHIHRVSTEEDISTPHIEGMNIEIHDSIDEETIEIHSSSDEEMIKDMPGFLTRGRKLKRQGQKLLHELFWDLLRCVVPDIKHIHDKKLVHTEAVKLLVSIFKEIPKLSKSQLVKMDIDKAIYDAIKHGIIEFIEEILGYNPEIIWRKDSKGRTLFAHAIVLRQEKIFSLIYKFELKKSIIACRHDIFYNNFLHLAAKLSPPSQLERVSGAALQMQRELQWFKEVEIMVQPKYKEEVNENNKTPSTLFTDEHEELAKEGERWMKNTAGSSMIVGTLIAAVMFTTAFTVPGGNEQSTGVPILLMKAEDRLVFFIFMVSNAFSMFASSTSILMFLGILTARFAEEDFLKSLPLKLILGLAYLFLSIVTMMVSFGSSLYLTLHTELKWISIPIIVFSIIPVALYSVLQFPLLVEMVIRTYGSGIFEKPRKHHRWAFLFNASV